MSSGSSSISSSVSNSRPIRKSMNNETNEPLSNKTYVRCI